jgi:hypothetical protein
MQDASERAARRVAQVQDDPELRYRLARDFYWRASGPRRRYGVAELCFLRWCITRGVLAPEHAARPGSPWWRAVNNALLRDKVEAGLLATEGNGMPSSRSVELWLGFIRRPRPEPWYRAHNASIVAAYFRYEELTAGELEAERFMMNVALLRVIYTHALLARSHLALGPLAPIGPWLADPRRRAVGWFLDLGRSFPAEYPVPRLLDQAIAGEWPLARAVDYGLIAPRLPELYEFAAKSADQPRLPGLLNSGTPAYAWPPDRRLVWHTGNIGPHLRAIAWVTGASAGYDRQFG